MKLNEIFDKPAKVKWYNQDKRIWEGEFENDGITYSLDFYGSDSFDPTDGKWDLEFSISNWDNDRDEELFGKSNSAYGVTNTGGGVVVFSTVINAIKELIKKMDPKIITFEAKEASRQKLYKRLSRVIGSKFGYEIVSSGKKFELRKK
jgi:hypothetical protein